MIRPFACALLFAPLPAFADAPRVVTDIAPVHSLVARVMQGVGEPTLLVTGTQDPHYISLAPSQAQALARADVLFWIGPGLTPWLEDASEALSDASKTVALMDLAGTHVIVTDEDHDDHDDHGAEKAGHDDHDDDDHGHSETAAADHDDHGHSETAAAEHDDHGHDDHAHDDHDDHGVAKAAKASGDDHDHDDHGHEETAASGHDEHGHDEHGHDDDGHSETASAGHDHHDHGGTDPHAWLDPDNAQLWVIAIAERLAAIDPDHAQAYRSNAVAAAAEIAAATAETRAALAVTGVEPRVIVSHDSLAYFTEAFAIPAALTLGNVDNAAPSAARVAQVRAQIADAGLTCALHFPSEDTRLLNSAIEGTGAKVTLIDPLGATQEPGPALYPAVIRTLGTTLAGCSSAGG
ncbi:MAG: zinc ABC transporter substrate-binding protein [Pseudomonadota bacterium]